MGINDYRKKIFIHSPYCTYYNVGNNTVLAGILREIGYRYAVNLPDEKLKEVNAVYRKFTTLMNSVIAIEILLYIYLVIFPYYTEIMKMPYFMVVLSLSLLPLIALYLTYVVVNVLYENFLSRFIGTFQKVKFQPAVDNIDEKAFNAYEKTPKKSVYVLILLVLIFCYYIVTPLVTMNMNGSKDYKAAINTANTYLTFVPISAEMYAQRAYAKYKLKQYKEAVKDYEAADKYSLSDNFSYDLLSVKTKYLPRSQMLAEFDKLIDSQKTEAESQYLMFYKANYYMQNKQYNQALTIYNVLLAACKKSDNVLFPDDELYYNIGSAKKALGDAKGAQSYFTISKRKCPDCKYEFTTDFVKRP